MKLVLQVINRLAGEVRGHVLIFTYEMTKLLQFKKGALGSGCQV